MKTTKKKKILKQYNVDIQFHSYDLNVMAYSAADAKKKALKKLGRKSLSSMVDKQNTYVDKY